ncbi:jasmonate-induced oxygenase 1-like [Typha latifolia]|uniref:jasmonate-induced oxygenase 1-like n=1 Tax=Typha latifolia TaxID=4733 RepID=UPI003C2CE6AC
MDSTLKDWPEPIVPVQSLAASGIRVLPEKYVRLPCDRPSLVDEEEDGALALPVIDINGIADGSMNCSSAVKAISDACKEWGFFQVVNHGISHDLLQRMREVWKHFFNLPIEEKKMYTNSPTTYEGYGSRLGVEKGAILDWGDYYFLHVAPSYMKNLDKWPKLPCNLREVTEDYGREMVKLYEVLTKAMSKGLGLEEDYILRTVGGDDAGAAVRVNCYPKCPQPELTLGLSSHSDPGSMTILLADEDVKGLQVRKGNKWVNVNPFPGALVVNVGDQIQIISNAIYKSVEHRALANSAMERYSIALFYNPKDDLPIGPAKELVTPQSPSLYQPVTFKEYRMYVRKRGPNGKAQMESLKAM